jgi:dolichyl-diphosphooligosaccharide--protein glycosyltransferase
MAARPATALLAPLALLWALSCVFGYRLSMFGGAALLLGLCVPLHWLGRAALRGFRWPNAAMSGVFTLAALILAAPLARLYSREMLAPVVSQAQAKALLSLRATTPENAMLWTWWDHGYAATYFSRRATFADGGRNEGERLLPLGLALSTKSPKQANQLLKFCDAHNNAPWEIWNARPAAAVQEFLASLATKDLGLKPGRKNYLIVTIEQLPALSGISFYGGWRVDAGAGKSAQLHSLPLQIPMDLQQGLLLHPNESKRVKLASIEHVERTLTPDGRSVATLRRYAYKRDADQHLVIVPSSNESFLLDDAAYQSLLVRLLLFDAYAPDIAPYFKLVYEGGPLVRVYEAQ